MSAHESKPVELTASEQRLAQAVAAAVIEAFRKGGCPGACGLSADRREEMGHLVGMLARDQGIEETRKDLQFARAMRNARDKVGTSVLCLITGAFFIWAGRAIWKAFVEGPK